MAEAFGLMMCNTCKRSLPASVMPLHRRNCEEAAGVR